MKARSTTPRVSNDSDKLEFKSKKQTVSVLIILCHLIAIYPLSSIMSAPLVVKRN